MPVDQISKNGEILEAARTVFIRHGIKKATMDDIAKMITITRTALYYYYRNKDDLLGAVLNQEIQAYERGLDAAVGRIDEPVLHIGPSRDLSLFEAAAERAGRPPRLTALSEGRYALCTGLRDDTAETPEDYDPELQAMRAKPMTMICANPDVVIHRGDTLIYCAGALAERYGALGGEVVYAGKPHAPIYRHALELAARARGGPVDARRTLAVGDGMRTDIAGAARAGLDVLLVTRGIHRDALHGRAFDEPADPEAIARLCEAFELWPTAAIGSLEG